MKNFLKYSEQRILTILFSFMFVSFSSAQTNKHDLEQAVQQKISIYFPLTNFSVKAMENGRVELKGMVDVLYDKLKIFDVVSGVKGVHYIDNNIIVNTKTLPDKIILANIETELDVVKSISEPDMLDIDVNNGIAFLRGKVRFQHESTILESIASWQEGIKGIVNELQVMPAMDAISDSTISETIAELLHNQFSLEKNVDFKVHLGHVTLDGKVRTIWSQNHIDSEIQRIVGVTKVTNNLVVTDDFSA